VKRTYFMAVIDGVGRACYKQMRDTCNHHVWLVWNNGWL